MSIKRKKIEKKCCDYKFPHFHLNEAFDNVSSPQPIEKECKCHCHGKSCGDCNNVCFMCSETGIAGKSDRCSDKPKEEENERYSENELNKSVGIELPKSMQKKANLPKSIQGDWEKDLKLYLTSAGDRRRTIQFIKDLLAKQEKEYKREVIEIDDFIIKNIHGVKGLTMKKYVSLDEVLNLLGDNTK